MHFTKTLLASIIIPSLASSTNLNLFKSRTLSPPFHLLAIHPTSPLHLQPINARRGGFSIGQAPDGRPDRIHRCERQGILSTRSRSSPINISQTDENQPRQDVSVAGGQNLYVGPHGALSFTRAGSPDAVPEGAATTEFTYTAGGDDGMPGSFSFLGLGASALLACPCKGFDGGVAYRVFANVTGASDVVVPGGNASACVGIGAAAYVYTYEDNVVAYEYE